MVHACIFTTCILLFEISIGISYCEFSMRVDGTFGDQQYLYAMMLDLVP